MSAEYNLHKKLDLIIDNCLDKFAVDDKTKEKFKWYKLKIVNKNLKTYNGRYYFKEHTIEIYNLDTADDINRIKTLIHECSHHIDYCIRNKSDHDDNFYKIYQKLLYSALDLEFVDYDELLNMNINSRDYDKVMAMLKGYKQSPVKIDVDEEDKVIFKISNCYKQKDDLKDNEYHWNAVSKTWDKEVFEYDLEEEKSYLIGLGLNDDDIDIVDGNKIDFKAKKSENFVDADETVFLISGNNSYEHKEDLKAMSYRWDKKNKSWYKKIKKADAEEERNKLIALGIEENGIRDIRIPRFEEPKMLFKVSGSFDFKDQLKEHGYHWNKKSKTWDKEINLIESSEEEEKEMLIEEIGIFADMIQTKGNTKPLQPIKIRRTK